jgi:DNA invertase Pin-like site-specific DNA recombinase
VITAGYVRVSGASQVDGDGPGRQRAAIQHFGDEHGMEFIHFFEEYAVSGTVSGMDRPALSALLEDHDSGSRPVGAIIVERMDRLARDLMVQEFIISELKKRNIKLFAADSGSAVDICDDASDPTRKLIRQILGALAEWEKCCIVKKLASARAKIRAKHGRCGGTLPFGAKPGEAEILAVICNLRAEGASLGAICKTLNREGLLTRGRKDWDKGTLGSILRTVKRKEGFMQR